MAVKKKPRRRPTSRARMFNERIEELSHRPRFFRGIIYSEPGAGKSTLAASSAEVGKTLIANADRPDAHEYARKLGYNPDVVDVSTEKEITQAWKWLRAEGHKEYDFFWLDSGTLFQESLMQSNMEEVHRLKEHRSIYLPDKPEYMLTQNMLQTWVRRMRSVPMSWGITAHMMSIVDEIDGDVKYMPSFQGGRGALSSKLCGYVGVVGRMYIKPVKIKKEGKTKTVNRRALQVQPHDKFYAKDGFHALGAEVERPTMAQIMELINSEGDV